MKKIITNTKNDSKPTHHSLKTGQKHSWHLEDIPKFKIAVPVIKSITIYISEFNESSTSLPLLLKDLKDFVPGDRINLIFNSPGGLISEGRVIINAILATGANIQTEILSEASSMAAVTFCIGDRRIVYENSSLMFHNFSGGYYGKGNEVQDHLEHSIKNITQFFKAYMIGLSDKELKKMISGKEYWFCAEEMAERGLATHVKVKDILIPAKTYIKALKKARKQSKKTKKSPSINSISEAALYGIDVMTDIVQDQNNALDEVSDTISSIVDGNEFLYN